MTQITVRERLLAIDFASEITIKYDATMLLLHAVPDETLSEAQRRFAEVEHIEGSLDQVQFTIAEQQLMTSARHRALKAGVKQVDTLVEPGDPAKVIIDHAGDVDVIVMGRRGLGPIEGLLQGSVSQKIIQLADAACLTVK